MYRFSRVREFSGHSPACLSSGLIGDESGWFVTMTRLIDGRMREEVMTEAIAFVLIGRCAEQLKQRSGSSYKN